MGAVTDGYEAQVLKRARSGDEDALGTLVDAHAGALIGYISTLTRDYHEAEDLAQETFLRAFDHLDRFDTRRPFRPWLLRIGRNLALNFLASRAGRERRRTEDITGKHDLHTEATPEDTLASAERVRGVQRVLGLLPAHFREVLHLRYMEGLDYRAIATELDLPLGTVKTWLHRAKRAFIQEAESAGIQF